jgi:hypothetical protein
LNKTIDRRIAYYLKKVAEKGSVHPAKKQPRSFTFRHQRLMAYKRLMHEQINLNYKGAI